MRTAAAFPRNRGAGRRERPPVFAATALARLGRQRSWGGGALRRRRLIAAALAVAAALLLLAATRPAATVRAPVVPAAPRPAAGEVAAPVRLADPAVGALLHPGDRVDVLAVAESPAGPQQAPATAGMVADRVRVLAVPRDEVSGSAAGGSLVVLAVTPYQARDLAAAQASGKLSVTLRG